MHPPDAIVAAVAAQQHGVVTAAQLASVGIGRRGVAHRVKTGRLTPMHRGVYRVGPVDAPLTRPTAAVLACGPAAVLSHHSAAALHGFLAEPVTVDVTVTRGQPRSRPGLRVHRAKLRDDEAMRVDGLRVTTPERTIRDLAQEMAPAELEATIAEAQVQRKLDHLSLDEAVRGASGRRGAVALRAAATTGPQLTRTEAERLLLRLVRQGGLPVPETNVRIGRYEVDALWRDKRLIVEVDGFAAHGTKRAFERDRDRDADLVAQGFRVIRITWRQLVDEPHLVVARLAAALSRGAR